METIKSKINSYLGKLEDSERAEVLQYLQESHILGNTLLEAHFIAEHEAGKQLALIEASRAAWEQKIDGWVDSLEPRLHAQAEGFFDGLQDFVIAGTKAMDFREPLTQLKAEVKKLSAEVVASTKAQLDAQLKEHQEKLAEVAEQERRKIQTSLIKTLDAKLGPVVEQAFKDSSDKFRVKALLRDVGLMTLAVGIALGLKSLFF